MVLGKQVRRAAHRGVSIVQQSVPTTGRGVCRETVEIGALGLVGACGWGLCLGTHAKVRQRSKQGTLGQRHFKTLNGLEMETAWRGLLYNCS